MEEQQGTSTPGGVTAADPMPNPKTPKHPPPTPVANPAEELLGGVAGRREVAGCPTGLNGLQPDASVPTGRDQIEERKSRDRS